MSLLTGLSESWKEQAIRDTLQRHSWMPGIQKVAEDLEQKLENPDFEGLVEKTKEYVGTTEPFKTIKTPGPIRAIFGALALGSAALYGIDLNKDEDSLNEDVSKFFVTVEDDEIEDTYWEQYCVDDPAELCNIKYIEDYPPEICIFNGEEVYVTLGDFVGRAGDYIIAKPICDDTNNFELIRRGFTERHEIMADFEIAAGFVGPMIGSDGLTIGPDNNFHAVDAHNYYVINWEGEVISTTPHNFENGEAYNTHHLFFNNDDTYLYLKSGFEIQGDEIDAKIYRWTGDSFEEKIDLDYTLQTVIGNFPAGNVNNYALAVDNQSQIVKLDFDTNKVVETDFYIPNQEVGFGRSISGKGDGFDVSFYATTGEHGESFSIVNYDTEEDRAYWTGPSTHLLFGEPTIENAKKNGTYGEVLDFRWVESAQSGYRLTGPSKYTLDEDNLFLLRYGYQKLEPQGWTELQKTPIDEETQNQNNNSNNGGSNGNEIPEELNLQEWYDEGRLRIRENNNYVDLSGTYGMDTIRRVFDVAVTGDNYVEGQLELKLERLNNTFPDPVSIAVKFKDEHGNIYFTTPTEYELGSKDLPEKTVTTGYPDVDYSLSIDPQWKTAAMNFIMGGGDLAGAYSSFLEERPDIYLDGIVIGGQELDLPDEKLTTSYDKLTVPVMSEYTAVYIASPVDAKFYDHNEKLIETGRSWNDITSRVVYMTYPEGGPSSKFAFFEPSYNYNNPSMRLVPDETGGGEYNLKVVRKSPDGTEDMLLDVTKELIEGQYYPAGTHEYDFREIQLDFDSKKREDFSLTTDQKDWLIGSAIAAPILMGSGYLIYRRRRSRDSPNLEETILPPPMPPEMMQFMKPQGWTDEQWDHYGPEYIQNLRHEEER